MYSAFVDSNILLDGFLSRTDAFSECQEILRLSENGELQLFTSSSCLLNVMYFLKKVGLSNAEVVATADNLLKFISLISPDEKTFSIALYAGFTDLEDAVQYYTALEVRNIDYFITSNTRDYKKATPQLPVLSPKQFMGQYNRRDRR